MARTNESAIQRLQVGLVGLLVVLICVSIASMILNRADEQQASAATAGGAAEAKAPGAASEKQVVEIGVTPVIPEQSAKQPAPGKAAN